MPPRWYLFNKEGQRVRSASDNRNLKTEPLPTGTNEHPPAWAEWYILRAHDLKHVAVAFAFAVVVILFQMLRMKYVNYMHRAGMVGREGNGRDGREGAVIMNGVNETPSVCFYIQLFKAFFTSFFLHYSFALSLIFFTILFPRCSMRSDRGGYHCANPCAATTSCFGAVHRGFAARSYNLCLTPHSVPLAAIPLSHQRTMVDHLLLAALFSDNMKQAYLSRCGI